LRGGDHDHAGVVDQHVQRSETTDAFGNHLAPTALVAYVVGHESSAAGPRAVELRGKLRTRAFVDVREQDTGTLLDHRVGIRTAESGGGPGDEGDFAGQSVHD